MPEHITLDTALAEAQYALNRALTGFVIGVGDRDLLSRARDVVCAVREHNNPDFRP